MPITYQLTVTMIYSFPEQVRGCILINILVAIEMLPHIVGEMINYLSSLRVAHSVGTVKKFLNCILAIFYVAVVIDSYWIFYVQSSILCLLKHFTHFYMVCV